MAGYTHRRGTAELHQRIKDAEMEAMRERRLRHEADREAGIGRYLIRELTEAEAELETERTITWVRTHYPEPNAVRRDRLERVGAEAASWIDPRQRRAA